jgi:putative acyl-CoA dehydrogenase
VLVRGGNATVSDAFCESRLAGSHGQAFGTLSKKVPFKALIDRAFPG